MKKTVDGVAQLPRIWYYLLDYNDQNNWETIEFLYKTNKLSELTDAQFKNLFYVASQQDTKIS